MTTYSHRSTPRAPGAVVPVDLSRSIRTHVFAPVTALFVLLTILCAFVTVPVALQYIPFVLSLVILGLPHGSMDHLVPAWLDRRGQSAASIVRVVVLYGTLAGVTAALWWWSPAVAAVGFVALTWFHWGQGDLYVLVAVNESRYLGTRSLRGVAVLIRGALPMLVPLVCHPDTYRAVLDATVRLIDPAAPSVALVDGVSRRALLACAFVTVIGAAAVVTRRRCLTADDRRSWWRDQTETVVLLAFFAVVPPILAVGLYFSLWHALRHVVRLEQIGTDPARPLRSRCAALARAGAPTTAAALVLLSALAAVLPGTEFTGSAALGVYLVLISALTVPHVAVVSYMDYRQRLWRTVRPVR